VNPVALLLILLLRAYRLLVSPLKMFFFGPGAGCRYQPSCSAYAIGALEEHGVVAGLPVIAGRLCRCHPWGGEGHDPVPVCRKP
jgi:putative membrane protein insertion efficiency factor